MSASGTSARLGVVGTLADAIRSGVDGVSAVLASLFGRTWLRDGFAILVLAALAAYSLTSGFDLSILVNADGLQPIQSLYFPLLEYRPPPSNNLFPDVLLHALALPLFPDLLTQKLAVGWTIVVLSLVLIGMFKGALPMLMVFALFALTGFGFVDSSSHYALPLLVLLYQLSRPRLLRNLVLLVAVFSDVLVVLPLLVLILAEDEDGHWFEKLAILVVAALGAEVIYAELSKSFMQIAIAAPLFAAAILIARPLRLVRPMLMVLVVLLPLAALTGFLSPRYAIPVAASFVLILAPTRAPRFEWRALAVSAAAIAIFAFTVNTTRLDLVTRQFDCLLAELQSRGISNIAADHWTAKPLWFAARDKDAPLVITQVDFEDNATSLWMAPYSFAGAPATYAVRSNTYCAFIEEAAQFCGQDKAAPVTSATPLCEGLELFAYATTIPAGFAAPTSKWDSLIRNLTTYVQKVI